MRLLRRWSSAMTMIADATMTTPERAAGGRVPWYRCYIPREEMSYLNRKSNFLGFCQTLGYLGLLATTGTAAVLSTKYLPWYACIPIFYFHGMCWAFLINGFHELIHDSVFKQQWLNAFFLRIF